MNFRNEKEKNNIPQIQIGEDNPRKPSQCKGKQSHLDMKVNQNEVQVLTDLKVQWDMECLMHPVNWDQNKQNTNLVQILLQRNCVNVDCVPGLISKSRLPTYVNSSEF